MTEKAHLATEELAALKRAKTDKRRYVKVSYDGASFIDNPAGAAAFLADAKVEDPDTHYTTDDVWLTDAEFEALPEFQGF